MSVIEGFEHLMTKHEKEEPAGYHVSVHDMKLIQRGELWGMNSVKRVGAGLALSGAAYAALFRYPVPYRWAAVGSCLGFALGASYEEFKLIWYI